MSTRNPESQLNAALAKVKYKNSDLTKKDVLGALRHYRGLLPKQDTFIFNDGVQRDLVTLEGTIPVPYKGNNYNIPVSIWLMETHPLHAPVCYVKPTQNMQIKVSKHVDSSGKIYLPYLHEWNQNSDLIGLIQICIVTFSEQPPVYSKKADPAPQNLPYPSNTGGQPQTAAYPGYPPAGVQPQYPSPGNGGQAYPTPYPAQQRGPAPMYPPYPPHTTGYPPYAGHQGGGGGYAANPPPAQQQQAYLAQNSAGGNTSSGTITQEHIKASILSAVEDKVRWRIRDEFSTLKAEQDSLKKIGEDLTSGGDKLRQMLRNLETESLQLDSSIKTLEQKQTDLKDMITKLDTTEQIDVDEAVTAAAPLYRQLLTAYAEESATEDAIYFLGEALRRGVIDCETFLKQVRNLSRKQFNLRATMRKCRQKAGLTI